MTTFTTSDSIFNRIRLADGLNPTALQNFVNALNQDAYANAQVSAMVGRGDAVFELVSHTRLEENGAAAMYDSGRDSEPFVRRGGKFAIQLDQDWFVDRTTTVDGHAVSQVAAWATSIGASSRMGLTIHEVQHNASQNWYDEAYRLRDTSPASYHPELTGAERAAASVELMMRAEAAGWYADLQTLRSLRDSGEMTPTEYHMRTQEGTIYANLMDAELSGKAMGHSGAALASYVAEHAQGSLPSNYVANYTSAMTPPSVSQAAVRGVLGYALNDPAQMTTFEEQTGPEGSYIAIATYSNGERISTTYDGQDGVYAQVKETLQADGSFRTVQSQAIDSYNPDGMPGDEVIRNYDTTGRLIQVIEADGAHNDAEYGTRVISYDAQGRIDSTDVRRDDGTRDWTDYDQDSTQAWNRVESRFDAQGREDYANVVIDDGSRTVYDYDQTNVRGDRTWQTHVDVQGRTDWTYVTQDDGSTDWTDYDQGNTRGDRTWQTHVDAQGRTDWTYATQDDGSTDWTDYDQTGARGDSISQTHTDAQGRLDWTYVTQDDGSHDWADYDQTGARADSISQSHTDAQGRLDWTYVTHDDGSRDWTDYDQNNERGDSTWQNRTDGWGREDWASITLDDGSRNWYDYDQDGSQGWNRVESRFDAWGREDYANVYSDNGSRNRHDYDQDGTQGWREVLSHFDALGREAHANVYLDDGGRDWHDYDQTGSHAWSEVLSHFDGQGREDHTNMYMDDGSRNAYDYDQDGSRAWSRVETRFDAAGRQDFCTRYLDDGSRFFVDFDHYGITGHQMLGYNAFGQCIFLADQVKGVVSTVFGSWNPAYGEGLAVNAVIPAPGGSGGYPPANTLPPLLPHYDPAPTWDLEVEVRLP